MICISDERIFLINTETMSYGMAVNQSGKLIHLYWGKRLNSTADLPSADLKDYPFEEEDKKEYYRQEYSGWGGYFFEEPCLKLSNDHPNRGIYLEYQSHEIEREEEKEVLIVKLEDKVQKVAVSLFYVTYSDCDILERYAKIENRGQEKLILDTIHSASWFLPPRGDYELRYLAGKWAGDHQLRKVKLSQGKMVLESRRGISGPDANPWFGIGYSEETREESGECWSGMLSWCGNWRMTVETNRYDQVAITGGINPFDTSLELGEGESYRTPSFTGSYSEWGYGGVSRNLHHYFHRRVIPGAPQSFENPLIYNSWEACFFDFNEQQQLQLADQAARLGAEIFVVDDGWFSTRDDDTSGLGDWFPSKRKFPNGLAPLIRRVNSLGMKFGLWVEPEMVNPDSDLYRTHPDWVIAYENRPVIQNRNQFVLNLAKPEVREYIVCFLKNLLSSYSIEYIKWDMNRYMCDPGWPGARDKEQKGVWIGYAQGLYEIYNKITCLFPKVLFENCCSGGGRVEPGMFRYSRIVSRSDNADALDGLQLFEGYTQAYPPATAIGSISSCPNGINGRTTPLKYHAFVALMGTMQIGLNLPMLETSEIDELKKYISLYKGLRHITHQGRLYRLVSAYEKPWAAYEFVTEDRREAVLFVFGQQLRFRQLLPGIRLKGLLSETTYIVNNLPEETIDNSGDVREITGCALMNVGLTADLKGDYDCRLFHLKGKEDHYEQ